MGVVLLVSAGKVAAVVIGVVLLLAVVGQGLSGDLAAGDTASVAVGSKEQRIDSNFVLEAVEHRSNAFINKRDCAYLDAGHAVAAGRSPRSDWFQSGSLCLAAITLWGGGLCF